MSKTNEAKILLMTGGLIAKELCELLTNVTEMKISATTLHNRKRSPKYDLLNSAQRDALTKIIANPQTEDEMVFAESIIASHKYLTMLTSEVVLGEEEQIELGENDLEIDNEEGDASELDIDLDDDLNLEETDDVDLDDDLNLEETDDVDLDDDLNLEETDDINLDDDLNLEETDDVDLDDDLNLEETDELDDLLNADENDSLDDLSTSSADDDLDIDL